MEPVSILVASATFLAAEVARKPQRIPQRGSPTLTVGAGDCSAGSPATVVINRGRRRRDAKHRGSARLHGREGVGEQLVRLLRQFPQFLEGESSLEFPGVPIIILRRGALSPSQRSSGQMASHQE